MSKTVIGAQDVATAQEQGFSSVQTTKGWAKQDTTWVISLFGTAVGAGILFLPINAGMGGFWPLVVMALLVGPMTYLAHRGLARFVLSSKQKDADITKVVEEHFGVGAGKLITLLYFFAIYPIVLIYGVGITNTVESFMVNQLQMAAPPRWILSIVLIMGMMSVMLAGEKLMLKVTEFPGLPAHRHPGWYLPLPDPGLDRCRSGAGAVCQGFRHHPVADHPCAGVRLQPQPGHLQLRPGPAS